MLFVAIPHHVSITLGKPQIVFQSGEPAITGFSTFRIPAIAFTKNFETLAFAEGRRSVLDQSQNEIVMREKPWGAKKWGPIRVVESAGENSLNNPCVLVDGFGTVWLMYQQYPKGKTERSVSTGYSPSTSCQSFVIDSRDQGRTWSAPINITRLVRPLKERSVASGPGNGLQIQAGRYKGRLVFPFNEGSKGLYQNFVVYSDDGGITWQRGADAPEPIGINGNECQIAEGANGNLIMNSRNQGRLHYRLESISKNGGESWSELKPNRTLIDPVCTGSILRVSFRPSLLAFCNPASRTHRILGTLRLSFDQGASWPQSILIKKGSFQYSSMCVESSHRIGLLYESVDLSPSGKQNYDIWYLPIKLKWEVRH